jgi:translation elongation factor EF-1alpha
MIIFYLISLIFQSIPGKTIEFGIVHTECSQVELKIVDLPGSKRYLKNFLYGISIVDYAVVVISAIPGEYEASMLAPSVETR